MLQRAAVLIGVRKTGGDLPVLRAVGTGIEAMAKWAESQRQWGMQEVVVLSDANAPDGSASEEGLKSVTAEDVSKAIARLVKSGTEQLVVYFAGHGANVRYNELWLLSGAPEAANQAVNVDGSLKLARQSGVAHVVVISDACRTAAATVQAQAVEGSLVFPNLPPATRPGRVDTFYATVLSRPALEVSSPEVAEEFVAVYTKSLTEGLAGKAPLEDGDDGGQPVRWVRPWPLQWYLEEAVPNQLQELGVPISVDQTPDAIITSPPTSWISQLAVDTTGRGSGRGGSGGRRGRAPIGGGPPAALGAPPVTSLRSAAQAALAEALQGPPRRAMRRGLPPRASAGPLDEYIARATRDPAEWGDLKCGFVVRGHKVTNALSAGPAVERIDRNTVQLPALDGPTSVLLVVEDGRGALLPAIAGYVAELIFDDGELASVTYEPSSRSLDEVAPDVADLRALRTVVAAASRLGVFRPERVEDREMLVDRLRAATWLDPALAVYAAYALASLGESSSVIELRAALQERLRIDLFDVALLARTPGEAGPIGDDVFPAVPLLAQGWALLDAYGVELPAALRGVRKHVTNSLWTLFDEPGVAAVRAAIGSREIR